MNCKTREEAQEAGEATYFTGTPCELSSHLSPRSADTGECVECARVRWSRVQRHLARSLFRWARQRAKEDNLPFSITMKDIDVSKECPHCGVAFDFGEHRRGHPGTATLDRNDPEKGYVPGNVWVLCGRCNTSKGRRTYDEYEKLGRRRRET